MNSMPANIKQNVGKHQTKSIPFGTGEGTIFKCLSLRNLKWYDFISEALKSFRNHWLREESIRKIFEKVELSIVS